MMTLNEEVPILTIDKETRFYVVLAGITVFGFVMYRFFSKNLAVTSLTSVYGLVFFRTNFAFWLWFVGLVYLCHFARFFMGPTNCSSPGWLHRMVLRNALVWSAPGILLGHNTTASAYSHARAWVLDVVQILLGLGIIVHELALRIPWLKDRNLSWKWSLSMGPILISVGLWFVLVWNESINIALAEQEAMKQLSLPAGGFVSYSGCPPLLPRELTSTNNIIVNDLVEDGISPLSPEAPLYMVAKSMQKFQGPRQVMRKHMAILYCETDLWLEENGAAIVSMMTANANMPEERALIKSSRKSLERRQKIGCGRRRYGEYHEILTSLSLPPSAFPVNNISTDSIQAIFLNLMDVEQIVGNMVVAWDDDVEEVYFDLYQRLMSAFNSLDTLSSSSTAVFEDEGSSSDSSGKLSWWDNAHAMPCRARASWLPFPPPPACIAEWSLATPYGAGAWWHWFQYFLVAGIARSSRKDQQYLHAAILQAIRKVRDEQLLDKATNLFRSFTGGRSPGQILNSLPEHITEIDLPPPINIFKAQWRLKKIKKEFQVAHSRCCERVPELAQVFSEPNIASNETGMLSAASALLCGNGVYGFRARVRKHEGWGQKRIVEDAKESLSAPKSYQVLARPKA